MVRVENDESPAQLQSAEELAPDTTAPAEPEVEPTSAPMSEEVDKKKPAEKWGWRTILFGTPRKPKKKSRKWLVGGGILGGSILFGILIVLLIIASTLKIPNLASSILEYDFARMIRQSASAEDRVAEQALTLQSAESDPKLRTVVTRWLNDPYFEARKVFHLDDLLPKDIIKNLGQTGKLAITDHANVFGDKILDSVKVGGKKYSLNPSEIGLSDLKLSNAGSLLGKISGVTKLRNNLAFTRDFAPALREAMGADGYGFIRASTVANRLRTEYGISLFAWLVGELTGKTPQQAADALNLSDQQKVKGSEPPPQTGVSSIDDAVENLTKETEHESALAAEELAANEVGKSTPQGAEALKILHETVANGGVSDQAAKILDNSVQQGALETFVGLVNPLYSFAIPACIVYEGSLDKSTDPINYQVGELIRSGFLLASAADEQKAGDNGQGWQAQLEAVAAYNNKYGDITQSNAYIRASGGTVDTKTTALSPEAGSLQTYTLIDATPGLSGNGVGNTLKDYAGNVCPIATNIWVGLGSAAAIQLIALALAVPSGGGSEALTEGSVAAADAATEAVTETATTNIVKDIIGSAVSNIGSGLSKIATKATLKKATGYIFKRALPDAIKITGWTILAKLAVLTYAGQFYTGIEQGADAANQADAGMIITAGELSRQTGGRPLTCAELSQTGAADHLYLAALNARKSPIDRYVSLNNPDSLLTRTALMANTQFSQLFSRPLAAILGIFNGPLNLGAILGSITGTAQALTPCANQNYGTVQFGWSEDEEKLIDSSTSYLAVQNQKTLDQSGKEQAIASEYANCFGYSYNGAGDGKLDPTDPDGNLQADLTKGDGSIGALLADGKILRTESGDLVTNKDYLCSPKNLSYNNPKYGDLVFRFRLALSYDSAIDQLTNLQTVSQ